MEVDLNSNEVLNELIERVTKIIGGPDGVLKTDGILKRIPNKSNKEIAISYLYLLINISTLESISSELSSVKKIEELSSSKGKVVESVNENIRQINRSIDNLSTFASLLAAAYSKVKDGFEEADAIASGIYPKISGNIFQSLPNNNANSNSTNSNSTNGNASSNNSSAKNTTIKSSEELQQLYNNSVHDGIGKNPNGSVSCAALVKRKAEQHGFAPNWYGNGKDVVNNITETASYSVSKYMGNNCIKDLIAAEGDPITDIVISFPSSPSYGTKYGHTIYVDQIVDGKMYFTDNRNPSVAKCMTIDEFIRTYNASSCGYPSGCAHLKSK